MKRTDGFDARRLRPRPQRSWASRVGAFFGMMLILLGIFLLIAGGTSFFNVHESLTKLAPERNTAITFIVTGLVLLWVGWALRRKIRRRALKPNDLNLSPRLLRKRN
ncbi:FeoB-associated Cys-rich membrane protein [Stutzerimonas stutzeri]